MTATSGDEVDFEPLIQLPFPPVTRRHIVNCSYPSWYHRYRSITPKARIIPLSRPFIDYLKADGIFLPPEPNQVSRSDWSDEDSGIFSAAEAESAEGVESDDDDEDPSAQWPEVHTRVIEVIRELGGKVVPKLNWSAPKDATFMVPGNVMVCQSAGDVYLLLKSSNFITHDLENVFDDTVEDDAATVTTLTPTATVASASSSSPVHSEQSTITLDTIPYALILRKAVPSFNPACEFRAFVRNRQLLCICQRDQNHYPFLASLSFELRETILDFFEEKLQTTFPDPDFVFDMYIPPPHERVWLVDINPFAPRTDPLLFSWLEILSMPINVARTSSTALPTILSTTDATSEEVLRLRISSPSTEAVEDSSPPQQPEHNAASVDNNGDDDDDDDDDDDEAALDTLPPLRLINKSDPEAYSFNSPQYSAHKLPRDVVDVASAAAQGDSAGLRDFAERWRELQERDRRGDASDSSDE